MKIRYIEIQNYKCHKNTIISNCSDFHTLVGKNSSGKTSILECCQLIEDHTKEIQDIKDKVYGTVTDNETKEIVFKLQLELSGDERRKYLNSYFGFKNIDQLIISTSVLKKVGLEYRTSIRGNNVSKEKFDNRVIITMMEVSDSKGAFIPIIKQDSDDSKRLRISIIEPKEQNSNDAQDLNSIDKYLADFASDMHIQKPEKLDFWQSQSNLFQNKFVNDFKRQLNVIGSTRESHKQVETHYIKNVSEVDEHGANIINLIDTLYNNDHKRFIEIENKCKHIFEDITEIHPNLLEGNKKAIVIRKKNIPYDIDLLQEGTGLDQSLIIIWKIATTEAGTICIVDEPELHLHPGAQKLLYDFLKDETTKMGKQIFIATQSMVFIHKSELDEVSIILNRDDLFIVLLKDLVIAEEQVTSETYNTIRDQIYGALGYEPKFSFEPEKIIVVEGKSDMDILTVFSEKLGSPIDPRRIYFIPVGDKHHIEKYSPILAYTVSNKKCLIILDNDKKDPEDTKNYIIKKEKEYKERIGAKPILNDDNFILYPEEVYSIEYYLLDAVAMCKAAHITDHTLIEKIKNEIDLKMSDIKSKKLKPKDVIRDIWQDNGFVPYCEVKTAVKISKFISKQHLDQYPEIENLIKAMTA